MEDDAAEHYRLAGWWTGRPLVERFESHVAMGPDEPIRRAADGVSTQLAVTVADEALQVVHGPAVSQARVRSGDAGP